MKLHEYIEKMNNTPLQQLTKMAYTSGVNIAMSKMALVIEHYTPLQMLMQNSLANQLNNNSLTDISKFLNASTNRLKALDYIIDESNDKLDEKEKIEIINDTKKIIKCIYDDNDLLNTLAPRKFEEVIAELLYHQGFQVNLTKQTRDGGYDILAIQTIGGFPLKFLVECKRHKYAIGIDIIRSFCDVIQQENANKGIIITTSYFSSESVKRQNKMGTILDLRNREDIINWVTDYNQK